MFAPRSHAGAVLCLLALAGCGPPPSMKVRPATEIGTVAQSALIVGRDGGYGARLWGREVFVYGDSFVSKADATGSSFHSNSFSFTDDFVASDGITGLTERTDPAGSPVILVPNTADEAAFIAQHSGDNCKVQPCGARWAMWPAATVWTRPAAER